jgi:translation initiation factor IF-2
VVVENRRPKPAKSRYRAYPDDSARTGNAGQAALPHALDDQLLNQDERSAAVDRTSELPVDNQRRRGRVRSKPFSQSLDKLSTEEVRVNILHKGVGAITETDVMLASASGAVIIGFNQKPTTKARVLAENEEVDIRNYAIIYDCINEIQMALEGMLTPDIKEETLGQVEIRKVFKISKIGSIAGCYVLEGKISRNDMVRVLRDGLEVYDGKISNLKREKDDVKEVKAGFECGIQLEGFNDIRENDIIEGYKKVEVKRKLEK